MFVVALALVGLIALLATLQYRWVGRISDAERDGMRATLNARASGFASDFDSELTRAYLMFQLEPPQPDESVAGRVAVRYDRWHATARYPRMLKEVYIAGAGGTGASALQRFNPGTRFLEPVEWPATLAALHTQIAARHEPPSPAGALVLRTMPPPLWESIPAVLIPSPLLLLDQRQGRADVRMLPALSYTVLLLDREYITGEMLPALARHHFRQAGDSVDYQVAVVSPADRAVVYHSAPAFLPKPDAKVDATVELFQVRMQEFGAIASEIRRFTSTIATREVRGGGSATVREQIILPALPDTASSRGTFTVREGSPGMSIVVQKSAPALSIGATASGRMTGAAAGRWRLMVKHPSGSLERAVDTARWRNLLLSTSVLAVLGASMALLVLSTRRAQELARRQMEFVAAVSHELRTPLAVIRSAGDNLADGVVHDERQIRKYGDLVRNEGRRLTEMVEQILEFAGIQSGQRGFALRPVPLPALLHDIVESSRSLLEEAGVRVECAMPDNLPPVLGDETALRRVFQNLVGNAIKYGRAGRWIGVRARHAGREVHVTVADRGIGISTAEQARIFEPFYRTPDVVAAQIQGAGLGLSLVKRIVEAHGGRITVQSAPGEGSEFTVILPGASEEPVGRAAVPQADARGSHA